MNNTPKKSNTGKIIAGLVIGGALGSLLGLVLAPHEGKKTRKLLKEKASDALEKGKEIVEKMNDEK